MTTIKDNRTVEPYLSFHGHCEEALEFYRKAVNAEVQLVMRFKESPEKPPPGAMPPGWDNKVMHASFRIGQSVIMASDGCAGEPSFQGFALSLSVPTEADADRAFAALADGGKVTMPLTKTFWTPRFGMLEDRFGVAWMINVVSAGQK